MHSLVEILKETYIKYPQNLACKDIEEFCTYEELWKDANKIAYFVRKKIGSGCVVPIYMRKSVRALKALWGILLSGNFYSVIDPMLPSLRINSMLKVLECQWVLLDDTKKMDKIHGEINSVNILDILNDKDTEYEIDMTKTNIVGNSPAYVMFTSGSTGIPKGVVVSHESVVDFINYFTDIFEINDTDIIGNQAPWDFDVSVKDIFSAAKSGATLQIIPKKLFSLPMDLAEYIEETQISTLIWAVSALCILSSNGVLDKVKFNSLKKVIFSGEVMPIPQLKIWQQHYPDVSYANVYGPTEITCNCTYYKIDKNYILNNDESVPIGVAFPNEKVFLIDEKNKLIHRTQNNKVGQICVSGSCVALGYYNNQVESEKKFVQNPLNKMYREVIYQTGDLAYYNTEGNLIYKGRIDSQIKYMGHRIELTEIENTVNKCEGVSRCCCIFTNENIIAVYSGEKLLDGKIKKLVRDELPTYMVPSEIKYMEKLPINEHGKIDRKKILEKVQGQDVRE